MSSKARSLILEKLRQSPYRFTSKQISDSTGIDWRVTETRLRELVAEGLVRGQNKCFVRVDRMTATPRVRGGATPKVDPRQRGFGFE